MIPASPGGQFASAAELLVEASRNLLAASEARPIASREIEYTASGVERGLLRAMRRAPPEASPWPTDRLPRGGSYGRLGAALVGGGAQASAYGQIGGMLGYAVGGPVGGVIGGIIGGLLGQSRASRGAAEEAESRSWLNPPGWFELQAYLYNLARAGYVRSFFGGRTFPLLVKMEPGAIQITGQDVEAGEAAARAFAGQLGHALSLNSVLATAPGVGGEL
jgi:hypothetical protein